MWYCSMAIIKFVFILYFSGLDNMVASQRHSGFLKVVNLAQVVGCLEDLITYFAQPEEEISILNF